MPSSGVANEFQHAVAIAERTTIAAIAIPHAAST
jgi:hypothetical protein